MNATIEYQCCVCKKEHRRTLPVPVKAIELEKRAMHPCKECAMVTPHALRLLAIEK